MERIEFINRKNERVIVDIGVTKHDKKLKSGLMNLWVKNGSVKEFMPETIHISTYVFDANGECKGGYSYNPQVVKGSTQINFEWLLANTPENKERLIQEVKRLANA